jgi:hypothetical protein
VEVKNVRMICFVAAVLFVGACPALGDINFKDGLTHNINYTIYDYVYVDYKAPLMFTTVNWLPGGSMSSPYSIIGFNNSTINVCGGYICILESNDFSQADISGGAIDNLYSYDSSPVNISGGSVKYLRSYGSSQLNITGGSMTYLQSFGSSGVNISSGSIKNLWTYVSSQVDIYAGSVGDLVLWDQSMIQIFGSDFAVDGEPFGYGELTSILGGMYYDEPIRHLSGTLLSGELIDSDFRIGYDARIILIPEPASALLMAIGVFALRQKRR